MPEDLNGFWAGLAPAIGVQPGAYSAFLDFVSRWQPQEGGWTNNTATYNPLNSTQVFGANNPINSVGVQAYADMHSGIAATSQTLTNGRYNNLLYALQSGDYSRENLIQADINTWVTGSATGSAYSVFGSGATPSGSSGAATPQPTGGTAILTGFGPGGIIPSPGDILDGAGNVIGKAGDAIGGAGDIISGVPGGKYIIDSAGNIVDGAGSIVGSIFDTATSTAEALSNAVSVLQWLLVPQHWIRLGFIAAGTGMVILGGYVYVSGSMPKMPSGGGPMPGSTSSAGATAAPEEIGAVA